MKTEFEVNQQMTLKELLDKITELNKMGYESYIEGKGNGEVIVKIISPQKNG